MVMYAKIPQETLPFKVYDWFLAIWAYAIGRWKESYVYTKVL